MQDFRRELTWIGGQERVLVSRLKAWSAINSGSRNLKGLVRMGEEAKRAYAPLGATLKIHKPGPETAIDGAGRKVKLPLGPVYHFVKRPKAKRKVLLTGHLDTVFAADHPFQTPRMIGKNILNGPGAADMKGGILVMLTALQALERSRVAENLGWEVILNSDEEIGSPGSAALLAARAKICDFGMTFEPALPDGTLAGARKGSGNFTIVARGRSAHAGREFEKGRNAVAALAALTCDLFAFNGAREGVTINPARLEGGGALNIVPDLAILRFNARVRDSAGQRWFEREFHKVLQNHSKISGIRLERAGAFARPAKPLSPANARLFEVLKTLGKKIGVKVSWRPTGGACDGNNLAAAGLPNIDTLGVRGGKIHTGEEFALLDSLTERAQLAAMLLLNYAAGAFDLGRRGRRP